MSNIRGRTTLTAFRCDQTLPIMHEVEDPRNFFAMVQGLTQIKTQLESQNSHERDCVNRIIALGELIHALRHTQIFHGRNHYLCTLFFTADAKSPDYQDQINYATMLLDIYKKDKEIQSILKYYRWDVIITLTLLPK